jgi:2-haloacid dehalogenase
MSADTLAEQPGKNRRHFLGAAAAVVAAAALDVGPMMAQARSTAIKAIAFDAFAIFDPRPVFRLAEDLLPGRGEEFSDRWRTRQFEYTWLRNSMRTYTDFWHVTQDALDYASKQGKVDLTVEERTQLTSAYLQLKPWPDVVAVIEELQKRGIRLALLTNWTPTMMQACLKGSALEQAFQFRLSTDRVRAFKPDPAAYRMGLEAFHLQKHEIVFVAFGGWDAAGAKAFGYPTYWVNRLDVQPEELGVSADATNRTLSGLPVFIDFLRQM